MREIIIKKPVQQRSKAKFEAILQACPRVLHVMGYAKTTAARLAVEADVGIGTLYDYFSCKEAVFVAYLDHQLEQALREVAYGALYSRREVLPTLQALVGVGIDFALHEKEVIRAMVLHEPGMLFRIDFSGSRDRIAQLARDFARNKGVAGRVNTSPLLLYTLENLIFGFQLRLVMVPDEKINRDEIVEELTQLVFSYLFRQKYSGEDVA